MKGRLENSDLGIDAKFPLLLRDAYFAHLLINNSHIEVMHGGTEATLNHFRNRFLIVRGRQVVKRTIYRCVICRRHQGKTLVSPPSPALPAYRVAADFCFQSTGVDFAGPLFVKSIYLPDRNQLYKAHMCLFTCATSRAVHLELVPDLEAQTFIRALKRFIARRGYPRILVSDNAKTFTSSVLKTFLLNNRIEKRFILPASPWWGGFYERLVRSVKLPLKKVLGKARLSYEEVETVLIEIEAVINSRPLTYLYDDDITEPLTPSHLLSGRNMFQKCAENSASSVISVDIGKRARCVQRAVQLFWNKFKQCYLAELREHHMYQNKGNKNNDDKLLKVNDVVLVKDDVLTPRSSRRLARVDSLVAGRDGNVRGGVLPAISKNGKRTKLTKPLQKLIPLEVTSETDNTCSNEDINIINNTFASKLEDSTWCADKLKDEKRIINPVRAGVKYHDHVQSSNPALRPRRTAAKIGELTRRINNLK